MQYQLNIRFTHAYEDKQESCDRCNSWTHRVSCGDGEYVRNSEGIRLDIPPTKIGLVSQTHFSQFRSRKVGFSVVPTLDKCVVVIAFVVDFKFIRKFVRVVTT